MSKLGDIQKTLKAPKNQFNNFGKYKYRNCEDILEALKPLLVGCTLVISDEIINIGNRFYVKATVAFMDDEGVVTKVSAFAREEESKKGMDGSQVTGAASSYARKYALNGLFLIDDTKDADSDIPKISTVVKTVKDDIPEVLGTEPTYIDESQKLTLQTLIVQKNVEEKRFLDYMGVDSLDHIISDEYEKAHKALKNAKGNAAA